MDKIKTLSAAIRYGSKLKPQSFVALFMVHRLTGQVHSCALGAAYDAVRLARGDSIEFEANHGLCTGQAAAELRQRFSPSLNKLLPVPGIPKNSAEVLFIIPHLNDGLKWSRERIADWLEENGL